VSKRAVVTGAASGIGLATARLLVSRGVQVTGWDRDAGTDQHGFTIETVDIADEASVTAAASAALAAGPVTMLVNAAGIGTMGTATTLAMAEWDRVMAINLRGTLLACRAFLPAMTAQGQGAIVNVGSTFGLMAREDCIAYAVSKAAVIHMTRCMAVDCADSGVRVNAVCPGIIVTPMTQMMFDPGAEDLAQRNTELHALRRAGTSAEVAEAIAFLLSDASSFTTGVAMPVDGGYTAGKWALSPGRGGN
jgi:meso-butanediol dehydrogenase/(S,S)-butanediol dehydrogenase/diacetyl reductase